MLLAIDIGNTNLVIGCIENDKILFKARIATDAIRTSDQYGVEIKNMMEAFGVQVKDIDDCKARLKKIEELTIQMAELVKTSQEANQKALDDHNDRLTALEHRPSMWWDKLLSAGISAGVAALISLIASVIVR